MRKADVYHFGVKAGILVEDQSGRTYRFNYLPEYEGPPISVTIPLTRSEFVFDEFPAFFDGLLPEGQNLDAMLRILKIDRADLFSQIVAVGNDLPGAVTVKETTA